MNAQKNQSGRTTELLRDKLLGGKEKVLGTQFPALDEILHGGLRKGLTCLSGARGVGKTTAAYLAASGIARSGKKVVLITYGATDNDVLSTAVKNRAVAIAGEIDKRVAGLSLEGFPACDFPEDTLEIIDQAAAEVAFFMEYLAIIEASISIPFVEMRKFVSRLSGLSAIIIDGIDALYEASKIANSRFSFARLLQNLQVLAAEKRIPVFFTFRIGDSEINGESEKYLAARQHETICSICDTVVDLEPTVDGRRTIEEGGAILGDPVEESFTLIKGSNGVPGTLSLADYYSQLNLFVEKS